MKQQQMQRKQLLSPHLSIYKWSTTMVASLLHRASGLLLVAAIVLFFVLFYQLQHGASGFDNVVVFLHSPLGKSILWLACVAFVYHLSNGIRFLCLDIGWGESKTQMRASAKVVVVFTIVVAIVLAVLL